MSDAVTVEVTATGGPEGDVIFSATFPIDGTPSGTPGPAPNADVTMALTYALALAAHDGDADLNASFMRGDVKTTGRAADLFTVLAALKTDEGRSAFGALQLS